MKVNNNRQGQRLYWLPEERQAARKRLGSSGHDSMTEKDRISENCLGLTMHGSHFRLLNDKA